jgi:hypothetical protein
MGWALKSCLPWICSHADSFGLILDPRSRLRVSSACGIVLSQRYIGKLSSVEYQPAARWFLAVLMALSAALLLCGHLAGLIDTGHLFS